MLVLGSHSDPQKGLVCISERDTSAHCAVIGQSGSGKSFCLARYLEELVLRTRARVVILDPNGDFGSFWRSQDGNFWLSGSLAQRLLALQGLSVKANLIGYDTEAGFRKVWETVRFQFVTAGHQGRQPIRTGAYAAPLMLHWKFLGAEQDFLVNVDPIKYPKIHQGIATCHHYVAVSPAEFPIGASLRDLEFVARAFAERRIAPAAYPESLALNEDDWLAVRLVFRQVRKRFFGLWYDTPLKGEQSLPTDLQGYMNYGFRESDPWQVCSVGLASTPTQHMHLSALACLNRLWTLSLATWRRAQTSTFHPEPINEAEISKKETNDADVIQETDDEVSDTAATVSTVSLRVPTIVVIDEAHNFAPASPTSDLQARVSDRIATIAAEGRKYGLFLLLSTQRPQKLRAGLLQECENACLLRVQSAAERAHAAEALGVPSQTVDQIGNFLQGQALLLGRWVPGYSTCDFGPARTVLGGSGIRPSDWIRE